MAMSGRELISSFVGLAVAGDRLKDLAGERRDGRGREVFFAKLDEVDAVGRPAGGLAEERGLLLRLVARSTERGW